jgi:predicted nucleotidyltransferase
MRIPILKVRWLLNLYWGQNLCKEVVTSALELTPRRGAIVFNALVREGYIVRDKSTPYREWTVSDKGSSLCSAKAIKPIHRKTADRLLAELLSRVRAVNESPDLLYRVRRVAVFGSYVTDTDRLSDLDVAIELTRKEPDPDRYEQLSRERVRLARQNGRSFYTFHEILFWPRNEIWLYLQSRSKALSLLDMATLLYRKFPYRIVYEWDGAAVEAK